MQARNLAIHPSQFFRLQNAISRLNVKGGIDVASQTDDDLFEVSQHVRQRLQEILGSKLAGLQTSPVKHKDLASILVTT